MMGLFGKKQKEKVTLEKQLEEFSAIGIRLNPGITINHLLLSYSREKYESEPYDLLLIMMGVETEDDDPKRISDNVWGLDTECINEDGDYVNIAQNMTKLAGSCLPIEEIQDHVDFDSEVAWLSFKLDGIKYKWDLEWCGDYIDPNILEKFEKLLTKKTTAIKFHHIELGGQSCSFVCMSNDQVKALKKLISFKIT